MTTPPKKPEMPKLSQSGLFGRKDETQSLSLYTGEEYGFRQCFDDAADPRKLAQLNVDGIIPTSPARTVQQAFEFLEKNHQAAQPELSAKPSGPGSST